MAKKLVNIRVEEEDIERMKLAASAQGKNLTTYILSRCVPDPNYAIKGKDGPWWCDFCGKRYVTEGRCQVDGRNLRLVSAEEVAEAEAKAVREEARKPPPPPASSSEPQQLPQGLSSPPVTSGSQESTPSVGQKTALQVANQHGVPLAIAQRMIREGRA